GHEEHLESTSSQPQDTRNTDASENSGNSNPTATSINPSADQLETLTVETPIPTVSSPVPTVCFTDSQEPSSETRLISKRVTNQEETPSLDNILTLFLAYASFMGFTVYQMDVKCAFLYGTIDEKVYVMQPPGFHDPEYPARVYKLEKAMYGLHQAPRAWYDVRSSNTPMDKENPWGKDGIRKDIDLHLYRSMIGSLMYLTASRPDILFAICACARHQVTPKEC
nr:putative ribonuclease H-like domain-containing protein [Tanacetum cinerariifolium]